ncbi:MULTISPECIES: hypothetical protein [unclassified Amycolatopsis]|uniref:hypothetical protein n=1 Tax=unclassified Amycolatopsis TaxID=2618356 RepID=UPI002E1B6F5A|nr:MULTISPECIES: hypothetical protein [unclassified Amycolatopsis]
MDVTGVVATDAGLFGLWSPASFAGVVDYPTWEAALLDDDDLKRHIVAGAFVPVNIGDDGAFQVLARAGSESAAAGLTQRERRYLLAASKPYLFRTTGDAKISGIEHVGAAVDAGLRVPLPAGRWSVTIALIEWDAEPGQKDTAGRPAPTALPDFVLLLNPDRGAGRYRTEIRTFDR